MIYHKDIFLPKGLISQILGKTYELTYSPHAMEELNDKYGTLSMYQKLTIKVPSIVEIYTDELSKVVKMLLRLRYNAFFEACLVLEPIAQNTENRAIVRTNWLCKKNDKHATLDKSIYCSKL
jgi:hypothetical protein